jgi:hypothetical protein
VLGYLKKYEHIDQMPQDELEKVMAYYESLKEPKQSKQPPPTESRNPSSRQQLSSTPNSQHAPERREPIRPKETAGGIIYGSQQNLDNGLKPPSRYAEVGIFKFRLRTRQTSLLETVTITSRKRLIARHLRSNKTSLSSSKTKGKSLAITPVEITSE